MEIVVASTMTVKNAIDSRDDPFLKVFIRFEFLLHLVINGIRHYKIDKPGTTLKTF